VTCSHILFEIYVDILIEQHNHDRVKDDLVRLSGLGVICTIFLSAESTSCAVDSLVLLKS
jgi:hypothetical protein